MEVPVRALLLLTLVACSDYRLNADQEAKGALDPDIRVDPEAISQVACGSVAATVTVANDGGGTLQVGEAAITGGGWTLAETFTPFDLDPGATREIHLAGRPGEAVLEIRSDDPDEPVVEVPLAATADQPPAVEILAPVEGEVLPVGDSFLLQGRVSDAEDAPETLAVSWSSDVDGLLGTPTPAADGTVVFDWPFADRAPGDQFLVLQATDTCGQEARAHVAICQQAGWTAEELDLTSWHFEGDAFWDTGNDWLQLTGPETDSVGTAFATSSAVGGDAVEIRFAFYIGGGSGADGISLTALDVDRMTTFLGGTGCGIGYGGDAACTGGPALPGWSIEVDTYHNAGQDPTDQDHLTFTFDGDVDDPAAWVVLPEMEDTGWHTMEVSVLAPRVRVTIDGTTWLDQDLAGTFTFPAYVGFTAGTGSQTNYHLVDALEVTEYACSE